MLWGSVAMIFFLMTVIHGQVLRYSSSCAVDACNNVVLPYGQCASAPLCYQFKTVLNTTICTPQVPCSVLDACISGSRCATNNSVCVTGSCCSVPVCMPLALSVLCNIQNGSNSFPTNGICPNATWRQYAAHVVSSFWNSSYQFTPGDFGFDAADNLYVVDSVSKQFFKYSSGNTTAVVVGGPGNTTNYTVSRIFIDPNGVIYTYESRYEYMMMMYQNSYRLQRYDSNNWISGTTIFGESQCALDLSSFCGCADIFVDRQGVIYCSDSGNSRVIKILPNASLATLAAGVTNSSGSQFNQLNNPQGICVDNKYILYVYDAGNSRVLAFTPGSQFGKYLFSMSNYYWYSSGGTLAFDNSGNIYASGYYNITRWAPSTLLVTEVLSGNFNGRVRLDSKGNMYTGSYMSNGIDRYNIVLNSC